MLIISFQQITSSTYLSLTVYLIIYEFLWRVAVTNALLDWTAYELFGILISNEYYLIDEQRVDPYNYILLDEGLFDLLGTIYSLSGMICD